MRQRHAYIAAGVVALSAICLWLILQPAASPSDGKPREAGSSSPSSRVSGYGLTHGIWQTYDVTFQLEGRLSLDLGLPAATSPTKERLIPFSIHVPDGELHYRAKRADGDYVIDFWLEPETIAISWEQLSKTNKNRLKSGLKKPFRIRMDRRGVVQRTSFDSTMPSLARNTLRHIARQFFPRLQDGRYQRKSANGKRIYEQTLAVNPLVTIDRTLAGLDLEANTQKLNAHTEGSFHYQLDRDGKSPRGAQGSERIELRKQNALVAEETFTLSYEFITESGHRIAKKPRMDEDTVSPAQEYDRSRRKLDQKHVAGTTFAREMERLKNLPQDTDIVEMREVFQKLLAFLRLDPNRLDTVAALLEQFSPRDARFDLAATLLAKHGSLRAQKTLLQASRKVSHDPYAANQLLFNFSLMEEPAQPVVEELASWMKQHNPDTDLYGPLSAHAAGAAYRLRDDELKSEIAGHLWNHVSPEGPLPQLKQSAVALGNLGHQSSLEKSRPLLQDASAQKRALGLTTLRRVGGGDASAKATQALLEATTSDESSAVRRQGAKYLGQRTLESRHVDTLARRLDQERDPGVARQIVETLGKALPAHPQKVETALSDFYRRCAHPKVCQAVKGHLLEVME